MQIADSIDGVTAAATTPTEISADFNAYVFLCGFQGEISNAKSKAILRVMAGTGMGYGSCGFSTLGTIAVQDMKLLLKTLL